MNCLSCGTGNPDGKRFCSDCGELLPQRCPSCALKNAPGSRFCSGCGVALGVAEPQLHGTSSARPLPVDLPDAERRQVSIVFCDMVGSRHSHLDSTPKTYKN